MAEASVDPRAGNLGEDIPIPTPPVASSEAKAGVLNAFDRAEALCAQLTELIDDLEERLLHVLSPEDAAPPTSVTALDRSLGCGLANELITHGDRLTACLTRLRRLIARVDL